MDLAVFSEEVADAVQGICGDRVIESHAQAASVLDALLRKPSSNARELAAVLGVTLEQLERCKHRGKENTSDAVYADMCRNDAVYTWNVLIQRVNQAAHWSEEYRDIRDGEEATDLEDALVLASDGMASDATSDVGEARTKDGAVEVSKEARKKATDMLAKRLEGADNDAIRLRLGERLEQEVFEAYPEEKDYKNCARAIAANLRRNPMLAANYAAGRIPPAWLVNAHVSALAPRMAKLQRRVIRCEVLKEVQECEEVQEVRRKATRAGGGKELQPPPDMEDPFA
eukprot:TRINITY_DN104498_c0_g1_i1.p1 TRINITY_DN104498_c0_g1~~TRINITY_DN104498_c0_g1_i1.p1  ORF type:complete len:285 (-),score=64.44 TRINITY_DN104498_c0_g1_i1:97-951(-)